MCVFYIDINKLVAIKTTKSINTMNYTNALLFLLVGGLLWGCQNGPNRDSNMTVNSNETFVYKSEEFQQLYDKLDSLDFYNAMSVGIIRTDTTLIWDFGAATDSSLFRLGSVSKSFAGLCILKLVEQNKVSLEDTLIKLVPELPFRNSFDQPVLLRHLVEATAGFITYREEDFYSDPEISPLEVIIKNNAYDFEPTWAPGTFSAYHNIGPFISGYIAEQKSGMVYRDFVKKHFFDPLGMKRASLIVNEDIKKHLISYNDSTYEHVPGRPAAAITTSSREMIHFLKMLINDGVHNGKQILEKESIDRFESSTSTIAARQLNIKDGHSINNWTIFYNGVKYHAHGGRFSNPDYSAYYAYSSEFKTGFVFMLEGTRSKRHMSAVIREILPFLQPILETPPIKKISIDQENAFIGCYQKIQKSTIDDPEIQIELIRHSTGELGILDINFDDPPQVKLLMPTDSEYIYLDDNPKNNFAFTGQSKYALVSNEDGVNYIQKISYPWDAYQQITCDEEKSH